MTTIQMRKYNKYLCIFTIQQIPVQWWLYRFENTTITCAIFTIQQIPVQWLWMQASCRCLLYVFVTWLHLATASSHDTKVSASVRQIHQTVEMSATLSRSPLMSVYHRSPTPVAPQWTPWSLAQSTNIEQTHTVNGEAMSVQGLTLWTTVTSAVYNSKCSVLSRSNLHF